MKTYGVYSIGVYLFVGILFGGNHYFMLPAFLAIIAGIGYFSNRQKPLREVKYNLFWLGIPLIALLLGSCLTNPMSLRISLSYSIGIIVIFLHIFLLLKSQNQLQKVFSLFKIASIVLGSLIFGDYLMETQSFLEEFNSLKDYWKDLAQYFIT